MSTLPKVQTAVEFRKDPEPGPSEPPAASGEELAEWPATPPGIFPAPSGDGEATDTPPAPPVPSGDGRAAALPELTLETRLEALESRDYRRVPKRTAYLTRAAVEELGGILTRKGTPRLEVFAVARAAVLSERAQNPESTALQFDSGEIVKREDGTFFKSYQGFAEDSWSRLYFRMIPAGPDPLAAPDFRRFYDRTRRAMKRDDSGALLDVGPAYPHSKKKVRDACGRRWWMHPEAAAAHKATEGAGELPAVLQCTGPPALLDTDAKAPGGTEAVDVARRMAEAVARSEELHREFSHVLTCTRTHYTNHTAHGVRLQQRANRKGRDTPGYASIGAFRPSEIHRGKSADTGRPQGRPCFVPWLVADVDGPEGRDDPKANHRDTLRIVRQLESMGAEGVQILSTGNTGYQIRLPSGNVGNSIFPSEDAAARQLRLFWERVCSDAPDLLASIDPACFRPSQLMRLPGTRHPKTGRRALLMDADDLAGMERSDVLRVTSRDRLLYQRAASAADPRNAPCSQQLTSALHRPPTRQQTLPLHTQQGRSDSQTSTVEHSVSTGGKGEVSGGVLERLFGGVKESADWGPGVGWIKDRQRGRNFGMLQLARGLAERQPQWTFERLLRAVRAVNTRNEPALPGAELRRTVRSAFDWTRERQAKGRGERGPPP